MSTISLACDDQGSGEVVVLLHAFPCDRTMWAAQADRLEAAGYRVIRPDLPGFGASLTHAADPPSLDVMAEDVLHLLDRLEVRDFVLGGLSMGGYVAMAMLRKAPERITALILADTKATADGEEARRNRENAAAAVLAAGSTDPVAETMLAGLIGPTTREERSEVVAQVKAWLRSARPEAFAWAQRAMARRPESLSDLTTFAGPALVVYGDEDVLSPPVEQRAMLSVLRTGHEEVIPGSGHLSAVERPSAVCDAIIRFLADR